MIRTAKDVPSGFQIQTDVCIIGSGAGGAVAACVLAEAGFSTVVLEEGSHVVASGMNQREADMYDLLYRDGGNQMTDDGAVSVLQGRTLGGSTVVNMADIVKTPAAILRYWQQKFGVNRFSVQEVEDAAQVVMQVVNSQPILPDQINRNNQILLEGAARLGYKNHVMQHNRTGCTGSGYCLIGCAYEAKRSTALTFLPRALASGRCLIYANARAEQLEKNGKSISAVIGNIIDHRSSRPLAPFRVEAKTVIVAAGAIHSPVLLQAAGVGSSGVGKNLTLQPQVPVTALMKEDVVLFRGIPQSGVVDEFEVISETEGLGGFRLEGIAGQPGMAASASLVPPQELHKNMLRFRQSVGCLVLVPDVPAGTVQRQRNGRPRIRYTLTDSYKRRLVEGMKTAARVYLAAGAESVLWPVVGAAPIEEPSKIPDLDLSAIRPASINLISAHPQGTCRMGEDPRTSVVDLNLRVHGTSNCYVMDASIFPTSASSHTMIPVMSFAYLAAKVLAGLS